ncbi:gag-pol polyprotein [Tanacetum coccineum]
MAVCKDDSLQSVSVQLDGKNYSYWSYVMKNFLRGKSMWGYVSGTKVKPVNGLLVDNYAGLLDTWEVNNSKVITWINNSFTPSIGAQLAKYDTAKAVWDHLARLYSQFNFAKQYQLETGSLQQNDMSIQDFFFRYVNLVGSVSFD